MDELLVSDDQGNNNASTDPQHVDLGLLFGASLITLDFKPMYLYKMGRFA